MGLSVRFAGDPRYCRPAGGGRFVLHRSGPRFVLPRLELARAGQSAPVRLLSLRATNISPPGPLADAVRTVWTAIGLENHVINEPVRTPEGPAVDARLTSTAMDQTLTITWHGSYAIEPDPPEEFEIIVELNFDTQPATAPDAQALVVPHPGFVAIDFGTSNSTAVLFDQDKLNNRPLAGPQAVRLRDKVIAVLEEPAVPPACARQFADLVDRVARSVLPNGNRDQLVQALRDEPVAERSREPARLYATLLGLERLSTGSRTLRSWLAGRLHDCYDSAFAVPGLDALQLFPVELDPITGINELPSRIEVVETTPLSVRLTPDEGKLTENGGADAHRYHQGLKQYLGKPEPREVSGAGLDRATVDTDQLIQAALRFLVDRTESYVAANPQTLGRGKLNHAVLTYPTVAPPAVRHRLRELMLDQSDGLGLTQVDTSYDEAIAAVMFFLMRDFGGEFEIGVEAVKARYRALPGTDDAWAQNVLVIDIGGGTTDIALVTMTLKDQTPADAQIDPQWTGRYYVLTPQVRGSTGNLQLGGEYLTLRVFRWLKAAVADLLLTHAPDSDGYQTAIMTLDPDEYRDGDNYRANSLVKAILAGRENAGALRVIEQVVPTAWRDNQAHEQAFWLIWQLADRAKLALGAPGALPFTISSTELRQVINAVTTGVSAVRLESLPEPTLELAVEPFTHLVVPPLKDVMRLATSLVVDRFKADPTEKLDRIILTGKTSALTQVREALAVHFGKTKDRDEVRWDRTGVTIEHDYSKLATAIGACWAESIRQFAFSPHGARRRLREGKTVLDVEVNNLFFNLPCALGIKEQEAWETRFAGGTELFQLDSETTGKARTEDWDPLSETVSVVRRIDDDATQLLGNFKYVEYAQAQSSVLDLAIWPGQIRTQLEVSHELDLWIHLCRGEPHYVVSGPSIDVLAAIREAFGPGYCGPDGTLPAQLPGDILVDSLTAGSPSRGNTIVFPAGELDFTKEFYDSDDEFATPVPGLLSAKALEEPAGRRADGPTGDWTFTLRSPEGEKTIGTLSRPLLPGSNFPTRYQATLDRYGNLRVHAGALPYRTAGSLLDVEKPGRVHTVRIPPAQPTRDEARDPFSGNH